MASPQPGVEGAETTSKHGWITTTLWIVGLTIVAAIAVAILIRPGLIGLAPGWSSPAALGLLGAICLMALILPKWREALDAWTFLPFFLVCTVLPFLIWLFMGPTLRRYPKVAEAAFFFGALVAISEIASRYRDEPLRAVISPFGLAYIAINGSIALAAVVLVYHFPSKFGAIASDPILAAITAGFGSTAVMRTRLAVLKGDDNKDLSIGPDYVIKILLSTFDTYIDRARASRRQTLVMNNLKDIIRLGTFKESADYLLNALLAFQNLDPLQRSKINELVSDFTTKPVREDIKYSGLGYVFLTAVGEGHFEAVLQQALESLRARQSLDAGMGRGGPGRADPQARVPLLTKDLLIRFFSATNQTPGISPDAIKSDHDFQAIAESLKNNGGLATALKKAGIDYDTWVKIGLRVFTAFPLVLSKITAEDKLSAAARARDAANAAMKSLPENATAVVKKAAQDAQAAAQEEMDAKVAAARAARQLIMGDPVIAPDDFVVLEQWCRDSAAAN